MKIPVYNTQAEQAGTLDVSDALFAVPMNRELLHQVVTAQSANRRQTTANAKGRSEVRGGGKKPWQQKGTGRARHGSIRSPIWKGGGVTHGPLAEKDYSKKINRKMARKALGIALSSKVRDGELVIVDGFAFDAPKTKVAAQAMRSISGLFSGVSKNAKRMLLVISSVKDAALTKSVRNLSGLEIIEARNLNSYDVLSYPKLVALKDAVEAIEKTFAKK